MLDILYQIISFIFPFDVMQQRFMQQALLALLILSPMTSVLGVHVINSKMAFFSDTISHSVFAGVALGLILSLNPEFTMAIFCILVGLLIIYLTEKTRLSSDTAIGVVFSVAVAFGLAIISRDRSAARNAQQFIYGDILSISDLDIYLLMVLFVIFFVTWAIVFNKMVNLSADKEIAKAHGIKTEIYNYFLGFMLSLVVVFCVRATGVLLVTAMLIVPAAAARNISKSAGATIWWAIVIGIFSSITGLIISAQNWAQTASGATVVLVAFIIFVINTIYAKIKG
jgi:zinc transport system permease protein